MHRIEVVKAYSPNIPEIVREKTSNKTIDKNNFCHFSRVGESEIGFNPHGSKRPHWNREYNYICSMSCQIKRKKIDDDSV